MKNYNNMHIKDNKPILSFRDLMVLLNVLPSDKVSIKMLRTVLSEVIPNSVYLPEIASSDTLTDEMIIKAHEVSVGHGCSGCELNCRQLGSLFPCFLFEAGIKYRNLVYKKDPYKQTMLVDDCFYDGGKEDRTYYTPLYFYDYIYYVGTGEYRNGRGHGKMSVHFMRSFFDHVIKVAAFPEEDALKTVDIENDASFLSQEFMRLFDAFVDRHMIEVDSLLEDSLINAFPKACKMATSLFSKRKLSVRDLLAVLIALSLSDKDCVNEYIGSLEEYDLLETDSKETATDEQLKDFVDDTEIPLSAPIDNVKRFRQHFFVCRAIHVALALFISGTDLLCGLLNYFNPESILCEKTLTFFLPLQPFLLVLCFFIKIRATTMRIVCDNASNPGFSAYLKAFRNSFIRLPSATERYSGLTAPEDEVLNPVRICICFFGMLSFCVISGIAFLTNTPAVFSLGLTVMLVFLTGLYTGIEHHSFFVSFDRTRRHVMSAEGKASAREGKLYFFKDCKDDYDPIHTRFMIDTFYYPVSCSRLIYHKAYTNKRDKACSIVLLTFIWDVFACLRLLINGDYSNVTESVVITLVTVCVLCGPFSSRKGYIYSMLRSKYLAVFCPPHEYSATLRKDILLHYLTPNDIISGKKAFLRSSTLYVTKPDEAFKPAFHSEIRISYDCFYRFSSIRTLAASVLLFTVSFYSLLTSLGIETGRILCLFIGIILYCSLSGGLFDNIFPVFPDRLLRKKNNRMNIDKNF